MSLFHHNHSQVHQQHFFAPPEANSLQSVRSSLNNSIMVHPLCVPFLELWELRDALLLSNNYMEATILYKLALDLLQENMVSLKATVLPVPKSSFHTSVFENMVRFMYASIVLFMNQMTEEISRLKDLYDTSSGHVAAMDQESQYRNLHQFQIKYKDNVSENGLICRCFMIGQSSDLTFNERFISGTSLLITPAKDKDHVEELVPPSLPRRGDRGASQITPPRTPVDLTIDVNVSYIRRLSFKDSDDPGAHVWTPVVVTPIVKDWTTAANKILSEDNDISGHHENPASAFPLIEALPNSFHDPASPFDLNPSEPCVFDAPKEESNSTKEKSAIVPAFTKTFFFDIQQTAPDALVVDDGGASSDPSYESDASEYCPHEDSPSIRKVSCTKSISDRKKRCIRETSMETNASRRSTIVSPGNRKFKSSSKNIKVSRTNYSPEIVELLKNWLYQNQDHPYPTMDVKEQLSEQTGLNITQINNWFINGRRRYLSTTK